MPFWSMLSDPEIPYYLGIQKIKDNLDILVTLAFLNVVGTRFVQNKKERKEKKEILSSVKTPRIKF